MKKVVAVFDIGKTNKKFFLFDSDFKEVYKEYIQFKEIKDEDGFPTENLTKLQKWLKEVFNRILSAKKYDIRAINFSSYGASFIHLDKNGNVLTPLYNYLKPLPKKVRDNFYKKHGNPLTIATETSSPPAQMLNSGMQLFWLKTTKPEIYKRIRYSIHFPQYLSFLFTGIPVTEFTSIGCHTALWDYKNNDYHQWVLTEEINCNFPSIISTKTCIKMDYQGKNIHIGVGIHDSSSALIPYLLGEKKPFVLISTGTWSVTLNPFNNTTLTKEDINNNCLNYLDVGGKAIRATRFFMGNKYKTKVKRLCQYFQKDSSYHKSVKFDSGLYQKLKESNQQYFGFQEMEHSRQTKQIDLSVFSSFEEGFHQLMIELVQVQIKTTQVAIGKSTIKKIYIDGGFVENEIFVKLIALNFKEYKVRTTQSPLGSALGAAMIISDKKLDSRFLKDYYQIKKIKPPVLQTLE
ncbi:FGGY family carbohydrate kinase [Aquimarina gracilis]|uniref:FGGY family carbohydrate kinase n=1 Tax=Aquimarina gracilis TaxID=874422 RepID=A0ABU5ZRP3_9FLAO|nr:FGGY family carbohydrate kinase [Aquimarina gracilis]MEB3344735.1 FGGY family carbohydrate kinase [Aquimarina gracilis]